MAFILRENYDSGVGSSTVSRWFNFNTIPGESFYTTRQEIGKFFTAESTYILKKTEIHIAQQTGYNGDATAELFLADGSGLPTGDALMSVTFSEPTITDPVSYSWETIDWGDGYEITNGTDYIIVCNVLTQVAWVTAITNWRCATADASGGGCAYRYYLTYYDPEDGTDGWSTWYRSNGTSPNFKNYEEVATPTKAANPTPTNAAADVTLDQATITWVDGGDSDSFNVYYGDTSGDLTLVSAGQAGTSFTVTGITLGSPYDYLTSRYWRVDSVNEAGTTTGDEWSFTTIKFGPPGPTVYNPEDGVNGGAKVSHLAGGLKLYPCN